MAPPEADFESSWESSVTWGAGGGMGGRGGYSSHAIAFDDRCMPRVQIPLSPSPHTYLIDNGPLAVSAFSLETWQIQVLEQPLQTRLEFVISVAS